MRNLVHKHSETFNKPKTHEDEKKAEKKEPCCWIPSTDYEGKCFKCGFQLFERQEDDSE